VPSKLILAAVALALAAPVSAEAQTFGPPSTIAGFGNKPALAQITAAALTANGAATIAGSSDNNRNGVDFRRAVLSRRGAPAQGFGPTSGAYDLAFASDPGGDGALTFSIGHVAYLTTCQGSTCRTQRVGSSSLKPQSAVAVQPGTGRTIVLWRGRTRGGTNRLQWRITTNGRLGATHTLGEFGDEPQLATDASGKTVAVWLADRRAHRTGVRTAARQKGEFTRPTAVITTPAADLRVVASSTGAAVAAWLSNGGGVDVEQPSGTVQVATRTRTTGFGAPVSLGPGSTVSLAGSPDGHALVVTDRHVSGVSVIVAAARRSPGGSFGPLTDIAPPQYVSDAYPSAAAIADGGRALVSWAAGTDPSAAGEPAGVFAALAEAERPFGAPEQLADAQNATLPNPTGAAISPSRALVAWTGPRGAQVAQSSQPK